MQGGVVAQQWRSNSSLGKTLFFRSCTAIAQQFNRRGRRGVPWWREVRLIVFGIIETLYYLCSP
ncbi:MAG TPA: hypothetical protein VFS25_16290 [Chitinophaga sp.]|uniref:hypothetical protein n=1 Tax=Chitinophaga sp. TaxID=1869181 RepID=UPI002DBA5F84|nr:hypothetical protein [Chitinophaga sp.]HEU4554408.1 hypothetical protein [Chitinophaga sp.]